MKEWFTIAEISSARLPFLPKSEGGLRKLLAMQWRKQEEQVRKVKGSARSVTECHISLFPAEARARLIDNSGNGAAEVVQAERLGAL